MMNFGLNKPPFGGDIAMWLEWASLAFARVAMMDLLKYTIAASLAFILLLIIFRKPMERRRIQRRRAPRKDMRREFLWSMSSILVYGCIGIGVVFLIMNDWTKIYWSVDDYGWTYWTVSLIGMIVLHDAWFYWTHRAMHHRRLFRFFHRTHHRSHTPSPWAAYSFAPPEAALQAMFSPIMLTLVPLHPLVLGVWSLHQITRNVLGHSGYELFPRGTARHWLGRWITTHTHHDLHHSKGTGNFGLYFTWWDRAMGTLRTDYERTFDAVTHGETSRGAREISPAAVAATEGAATFPEVATTPADAVRPPG